ncbi:hypothetical protein HYW76_02730 [Candidatus Pacearchaeota archaeon]|nr:hypothetical protein [Candidatus Pacearchaeota archaeon]
MAADSDNKLPRWADLFIQISTLIFAAIPIYFLLKTSPKEITYQALIYTGIIIGVVIFIIFLYFIRGRYKKMCNDIDINNKNIEDVRRDLNFNELFSKMDVRLRVLEELFKRKNKKGQFVIDPRIILWILLLILLYLFLKSVGFFK